MSDAPPRRSSLLPRPARPLHPRRALAGRRARLASRLVAASVAAAPVLVARGAAAQAPGLPTAQSAFVRPGVAAAVNVGHALGDDGVGTAALAAVGVAGNGGRWQLSGGVGVVTIPTEGYRNTALNFGLRAAARLLERGALGATAFVGYGEARPRFETRAGSDDAATSRAQIPIGVSVGYRGRFGAPAAGRGWAVSLAPAYVIATFRQDGSEEVRSTAIRATLQGELALGRRLGVLVAYEDGQRAPKTIDETGPRGGVVGIGISVAR